jgi:hypothetical protein
MAEFFWREGLLCPGFVMIGSAFRRANVTKGRSRYLPEAERCPDETLVSLAYGVPTAIGAESKARTGQCVFRGGRWRPAAGHILPGILSLNHAADSRSSINLRGDHAGCKRVSHHSDHPLTILAALIGFRGLHRKQPASARPVRYLPRSFKSRRPETIILCHRNKISWDSGSEKERAS